MRERSDIREEGLQALAMLSNEHRLAILRTLAEADRPLSFSELRKAVGIDDPGQFNYHLTELCERFVRDEDGGYSLGHRGERVVLAAGDIDPDGVTGSTNEACPVCGEEDCDRLIHLHLTSQ
jgi:DNA-binding transcriptional ArsR family regulator